MYVPSFLIPSSVSSETTRSVFTQLLGSHLKLRSIPVHCCCASIETRKTIRAGSPGPPPQQLLGSEILSSVILTSTETIRAIRDGEPSTTTSTCKQLMSSDTWNVQVHGALVPQRPQGLLGAESPGRTPRLSLRQLPSSEECGRR